MKCKRDYETTETVSFPTLLNGSTFPSLGVNQSRVHKLFSRTRVALRCVAYFFTQTPVDAWRKITFAAPAQNSSVGCALFFRVTRSVLISDRCAI